MQRERPEFEAAVGRRGDRRDHGQWILPVTGRTCLRLKQDFQREIMRTAALEKLDRVAQVDVVPHRQSSCRARLEARTLQFFRTPALDPLDLSLL
jgi:hypothetical protein